MPKGCNVSNSKLVIPCCPPTQSRPLKTRRQFTGPEGFVSGWPWHWKLPFGHVHNLTVPSLEPEILGATTPRRLPRRSTELCTARHVTERRWPCNCSSFTGCLQNARMVPLQSPQKSQVEDA